MKQTYKMTFLALIFLSLTLSFQNCGQVNSTPRSEKSVFVPFESAINSDYKIIQTDCSQNAQCLFTLHPIHESSEREATPVEVPNATSVEVPNATSVEVPNATSVEVPNATSVEVPNATSVEVPNATSSAPTENHCAVLSVNDLGDIYVSCPLEVQNDEGIYFPVPIQQQLSRQ